MKSKSLNIMQLTGLIKKASFVIANDTGPAHIAAHLGQTRFSDLWSSHDTKKSIY